MMIDTNPIRRLLNSLRTHGDRYLARVREPRSTSTYLLWSITLLTVLAGCVGGGGPVPDTETPTALASSPGTATEVEASTETTTAVASSSESTPGTGVNLTAILETHRNRLREVGSYTVSKTSNDTITGANGSAEGLGGSSQTVYAINRSQRAFEYEAKTTRSGPRNRSTDRPQSYHVSTEVVYRNETAFSLVHSPLENQTRYDAQPLPWSQAERFLSAREPEPFDVVESGDLSRLAFERTDTRRSASGEVLTTYSAVDGLGASTSGDPGSNRTLDITEATLTVDSTGIIHSASISVSGSGMGYRYSSARTYRYRAIGSTTVDEPQWSEQARAAGERRQTERRQGERLDDLGTNVTLEASVDDGVTEAALSASGAVVAVGDLGGRIWLVRGGDFTRASFDVGAPSAIERGHGGFLASWRIEELVAKVGLDGTRAWSLRYDDLRDMSPAGDADVVAVSRHAPGGTGGIGVIRDGEPAWNEATNASVPASIRITRDGTLLAVGMASSGATAPSQPEHVVDGVRVYERNGSLRWERATDSPVADVSLSRDGQIVVGVLENGDVVAYSLDGEQRWRHRGNATSVAMSADGSVIAVTTPDAVRAVDANGDLQWKAETGGAVQEDGAIVSADGSRLLVSTDARFVRVFDDGTLRWNRQFATPRSIAMNADGSTWSVVTKHGVSSVLVQTISTERATETERIEIDERVIETPAEDDRRVPDFGWRSRCDERETTVEHRGGDAISVDRLAIVTGAEKTPFTELTEYSPGETFSEGMSFTIGVGCERRFELVWSGETQTRTIFENDR
jgi:hypothetical protein